MDYKTEMCNMVDNITSIEVFRCLDVDMPDAFMANLEVQQIKRLMNIKTELQGQSADIREVQLNIKRFIIDLDVKEAYEFAVLNSFLISEDELHLILQDVEKERNHAQYTSNTYQSNITTAMQLELPKRRARNESSSEEDEDETPADSS